MPLQACYTVETNFNPRLFAKSTKLLAETAAPVAGWRFLATALNFLENFFGKKKVHNSTISPPPDSVDNYKKGDKHKYAYRSGDFINNRYKVVNILSGGMGVVYLCADHARQERPIALKTFKPKYLSSPRVRDRFLREGTIWVNLVHPHIVRAHSVERVGDGREVYLVMEWVAAAEGKDDASLRAWLEPNQPLSLEQSFLFALHIVRGMRYATTEIQGLVHRDLKPENVLVGRDGNVRVTDFGLAQTLAGFKSKAPKTSSLSRDHRRTLLSRGLVGTPIYMAPEQWHSSQGVDTRADIYAFGCILYEMLAGQTAAEGTSLSELGKAHTQGNLRPIPANLPREVKALIERCTALDPAKRCQSWQEVETAISIIYQRVLGSDIPPELSLQEHSQQSIHSELIATAWSYHAMGLSYFDIGHYDQAGGYFERVIWVGEQEKQIRLEIAGLNQLGNVCRSLSDVNGAIQCHQRQLRLARSIEDKGEEIDALGNLGNDYAKLGDLNRAVDYFRKQISGSRETKDLVREGLAWRNLGDASREMDRPKDALKIYEYALKIAQDNKDRTSEGRIIASLGRAYAQLDDTRKAKAYYNRALKIAKRIGDRIGAGHALGYLGIVYREMGDTEQAVIHLMNYLSIAREAGLKFEEGFVLSKLGTIYYEEHDPQQALEFFDSCLKIVRDLGDQFWLINVLEQVGDCYRELNSIDQAIGYYEECLAVAKNTKDPVQIAKALQIAGNGYRNVRDAPRAYPYYEEALNIAEALNDEVLIANISLDFALLLFRDGNRDKAIELSERAAETFRKRKDKDAYREAKRVVQFVKHKKWY